MSKRKNMKGKGRERKRGYKRLVFLVASEWEELQREAERLEKKLALRSTTSS